MTEEMFGLKDMLLLNTKNYYELKYQIEKLTEQKDELRNFLIGEMKKRNVKKLENQEYTISYSVSKPERLSQKKLKEELIARDMKDLYDSCTYKKEQERLTVKKRSGSEVF